MRTYERHIGFDNSPYVAACRDFTFVSTSLPISQGSQDCLFSVTSSIELWTTIAKAESKVALISKQSYTIHSKEQSCEQDHSIETFTEPLLWCINMAFTEAVATYLSEEELWDIKCTAGKSFHELYNAIDFIKGVSSRCNLYMYSAEILITIHSVEAILTSKTRHACEILKRIDLIPIIAIQRA